MDLNVIPNRIFFWNRTKGSKINPEEHRGDNTWTFYLKRKMKGGALSNIKLINNAIIIQVMWWLGGNFTQMQRVKALNYIYI